MRRPVAFASLLCLRARFLLTDIRHCRIALIHVVVALPGFVAAAKVAGLSDDARARIIDRVAGRPDAGDVIPGTGGARKVRFAGRARARAAAAE